MDKKFVIPGVLIWDTEEFSIITSDYTKITANGSRLLTEANPGPPAIPVTLAAIGSSPNANAASLVGQQLNLEPASGSFGGVVTTGAQTFAGLKTFSTGISAPGVITALSAIGASPNANGALITGSNLALEPASASFGGVVTTGNQQFAGEKQFNSGLYLGPSQQLFNNYKEYDGIVTIIYADATPVIDIYIGGGDDPVPNLIIKFVEIGKVVFMIIPEFSCGISTLAGTLALDDIIPFPHLTEFGGSSRSTINLMESHGTTRATGELYAEFSGPTNSDILITKYGAAWVDYAQTNGTQTFVFYLA